MKTQISAKIDKALLEWIDKQAKKENRSRNNYIETVLIVMYESNENKSYSKTIGNHAKEEPQSTMNQPEGMDLILGGPGSPGYDNDL